MFRSSPFIAVAYSTRYLMWQVVLALMPGIAVLVYWQGSRWLGQIAIAVVVALIIEALVLLMRRKTNIFTTISDGSAILTALLLALAAPVLLPPSLLIIGIFFALIFAKHLYGGLGMNLFNPAMLGYAFLLISFPVAMSLHTQTPYALHTLWQDFDALTAATTLDGSRALRIQGTHISSAIDLPWQKLLLNAAWALGGLYLVYRRLADWRIVVAVLLGISTSATTFWLIDQQAYLNPYSQLMAGASIFGAFFIATDPVSAATTPLGRWIYGLLIGVLTVCIRNLGNFPEGFAFAVLLSNALVVIIDPLTQPRYR